MWQIARRGEKQATHPCLLSHLSGELAIDEVAMNEEYSKEMKLLLTIVRECLNVSNRLLVDTLKYQGDFAVDFQEAQDDTREAMEALTAYNGGPLLDAFANLGKHLVEHKMTEPFPDWHGDKVECAAVAQIWYRQHYQTGQIN